LNLVNEPIALDLNHAHPQFLHVRISLPRDLASGGEVDHCGVRLGRDDDIDVGELDSKAADRRPRARGGLQKLVPSADRVLGPWDLHRDLHVGREELSQQAGVIGLGDQAFVG
jgi:hypothetical protein